MRAFDYRHLPSNLFDGDAGDANVRVHKDMGKLDMLEKVCATQLEPFSRAAFIDNVGSSLNIEALCVDRPRIAELVDGADSTCEVEAQAVGYAQALAFVQESHSTMDLSAKTVLRLHEMLYGCCRHEQKDRFRKKDYEYVRIRGHMRAMPVSPIPAAEVPDTLDAVCESLCDAFAAGRCSPLMLAAVFTVDLQCIRPFDEGNARISRLFAELMLEKAGVRIARYASIDRVIERSPSLYYDSLNACVDGWSRNANTYVPFVVYWLNAVHRAYQELFDRLNIVFESGGSKVGRVRMLVRRAETPVTKRAILQALGDVSISTVENALGAMVKEGCIEKLGAGRSTAYRWVGLPGNATGAGKAG